MRLCQGLSVLAFLVVFVGIVASASAARLGEVRCVDDEYIMVYWQDATVDYKDDGKGDTAFMGHESGGGDTIRKFGAPLDTTVATRPETYSLTSTDDANYAQTVRPAAAYRKTKVSGSNNRWPDADCTLEHTIYLKLPQKLQQGKHYALAIAPSTNSDVASREFTFDVNTSVSEAIHVNIIGYDPAFTVVKAADLYMWLGDGGARDYSSYVGRKVMLRNSATGEVHNVGTVSFWKKQGPDFGNWNLTRSDVWNCDFSLFTGTGTYRLVVEGVGCSPEFRLARDVYYEPFRMSVVGFFYMRMGEGRDFNPVPRQPRFIPGKDPANFRVYRTTMGPWSPGWEGLGGDSWDSTDWSKWKEPGEPTNPNAWGGHADACDWDRNPSHISIVWDLLLPYMLSNGKLADDNLRIRESGNGVPDIIDEAQFEADFWLRLRDGNGGYSSGTNNPPRKDHSIMYQAAAKPYMAWANAAMSAMLADAFRVAGKTELMNHYRDAAIEAWKIANGEDLDVKFGIGNAVTRGRDLKMLAAAFLYNVTGERTYEDEMAKESVCTSPAAQIDIKDKYCQYWGTAGYLLCAKYGWRPIHYPELLANMKSAILKEAWDKHVKNSELWPSRRGSDTTYGWFQATQQMDAACIAHAIIDDPAQKQALLKAMLLEADWGLGRNPLNMVQMTGLGSRCVDQIFASGRNDGVPGVHPGLTPYMNADAWGKGFQADPKGFYGGKGYPAWDQWPHGEALWNVRYCYANNEFTPQQTMRGKTCLLGYLYTLGETHKAP